MLSVKEGSETIDEASKDESESVNSSDSWKLTRFS